MYKRQEDTLCRDPALAGVQIIATTGGHHFDGDYEALARRILNGPQIQMGRKDATDAK